MAMSTSSESINVAWEEVIPPIDRNGIITMYEVLYQPLETFGGAIGPMTEVVNAPSTLVILTELEEYVLYNVSVRAYTEAGPSDYTTAVMERTNEDGK